MLRFCYAVSDSALDEALTRLARILPTLEREAQAEAQVSTGGEA
jgi:hypothetical protein